MITLLLNVFATGCIRLGSHNAAISKQCHAERIGQLHPLKGIKINREIPITYRLDIKPSEQGEITDDHQALNVMGIAQIQ